MYFIKELFGILLRVFGGASLLKLIAPKKPIYIVLNYHNFSKYNNYKLKRGALLNKGFQSMFNTQIKWLSKQFNFLYPEEFFSGNPKPGINLLLTFDDGYKDNYDIAFPILKKYNTTAIFFVVTEFVGSNRWLMHDKLRYLVSENELTQKEVEQQLKQLNKGSHLDSKYDSIHSNYRFPNNRLMMNWQELMEIVEAGFFVQPHTHTHPLLSLLIKEKQKDELDISISLLKNELNVDANCFAFPNGSFNSDSLQLIEGSQIKYSFSTIPGVNTLNENQKLIKRIGINASDSLGVILLKLFRNIIR